MKPHRNKTIARSRHLRFLEALVVGLTMPAIALCGIMIPLSGQELADQSDIIITAEVVEQRSKLLEDERGRDIYTDVTLKPLKVLKGVQFSTDITIEVVGGTFEGWKEVVSYSPSFETGEQCVLFLKSSPFRIVGGKQGKRTIKDGRFVIDGYRISPADFETALTRFDSRRSSGIPLKSYISEMGENIQPATRNLNPQKSQNASTNNNFNEANTTGGPKDLGGGQLPASEVPAFKK